MLPTISCAKILLSGQDSYLVWYVFAESHRRYDASEGGLVLYRDCCNIGNSVTKSLSTYSALTRLFGKVAIGSLCMHMAQDTGRLSCTTTLTIRPVSVTPAGNLDHGTPRSIPLPLYSPVHCQQCPDQRTDRGSAAQLC